MTKKPRVSRDLKIRLAIAAVGLVALVLIYLWPALGTAVDLALLTITTGLIFDLVWEGNKKLEEWENREGVSCSWRTTRAFFTHLEADIHRVDPSEECQLQIYRGYDQGKDEQNWDLHSEVKEAIRKKRVDKFRKVNVVTTTLSVSHVVDWITDFAEEKELRDKSRFYISFRGNQNVGSYVILGSEHVTLHSPGVRAIPVSRSHRRLSVGCLREALQSGR
ncbi:MAG TPA: hypothetical protein VGW57_12100 [Chthoniobacterales bacterium]|nr:hypothetical protein [Chthoniobacterales bacterium]